MKKIGKIVVQAQNNNFLARATRSFRIGSQVVNQEIKTVGKIVDVIGPTRAPYIVINTKNAEAPITKGDFVYLMERKPQGKRSYSSKKSSKRRSSSSSRKR